MVSTTYIGWHAQGSPLPLPTRLFCIALGSSIGIGSLSADLGIVVRISISARFVVLRSFFQEPGLTIGCTRRIVPTKLVSRERNEKSLSILDPPECAVRSDRGFPQQFMCLYRYGSGARRATQLCNLEAAHEARFDGVSISSGTPFFLATGVR
jgi:hypothetical protein